LLRRRNDFMERYNDFLRSLRDEIVTGELQPGEYILPENTLSEKYGLSRVSIRKALAQLVEEGLIEKIAGKGNRIKPPEGEQLVSTVKLAWFSNSYELDIVKRIIQVFEQLHPFVKIELQLLPSVEYTDLLIRQFENGQGPDLFMMGDVHLQEWIDAGKTDYLEGYVPSHLNPESTSYQKVFDLFSYRGKIFGAPFLFSPVVICYNKKLFRESGVPETIKLSDWDGLLEVAKQCTRDLKGDGIAEQYGFCSSSSYNRWPLFLLQNGGRIMSEDGRRCVLSRKENIEALEFCTDLMYKHKVSPIYSHVSNTLAESLFSKQRVAMILTTYYFMNEFRGQSIDWDIMPVPGRREQASLLLGGALTMNPRTDQVKLVKKLIDFMTGTVAQTLIKSYGCTIPALRSVAEDHDLLNPSIHPEHYNAFIEVLPWARSPRSLGLSVQEANELGDEMNLLWARMESPQEACKRIERKFNDERERRMAT